MTQDLYAGCYFDRGVTSSSVSSLLAQLLYDMLLGLRQHRFPSTNLLRTLADSRYDKNILGHQNCVVVASIHKWHKLLFFFRAKTKNAI